MFSLSRPTCKKPLPSVNSGASTSMTHPIVYAFSAARSCRAATQRARAKLLLTLPKRPRHQIEATHEAMIHVVYSMTGSSGRARHAWVAVAGARPRSSRVRVVDRSGVGLRRRRGRFELQIARAHRHLC